MNRNRVRIPTVHAGAKYAPTPAEPLVGVVVRTKPDLRFTAPLYLRNNKWCYKKSEARREELMVLSKLRNKNTSVLSYQEKLIPLVYNHAVEFLEQQLD